MRLFKRFPWLFITLGLILIVNNFLKFAPAQVMQPPMNYLVPIVLIVIGAGLYVVKFTQK